MTPPPSKKPPRQNSSPARPPQKPGKKKGSGSKFGSFLLVLQAILSVAAFVQLCRTRMLPALYLVIIAALLALFWLLVKRCQEYRTPAESPASSRSSCARRLPSAASGPSRALPRWAA